MDIPQTLQKRFKEPLRENYTRRIIFWKDPDREFENQLDELSLDDVKILKLTGTNNFAVKQLLSEDDLINNYLVYDPITYDNISENWLLDIELYSEVFRADLVSIRMQELGIPDQLSLRQAVKGYSKFFGSKERLNKLTAFHSDYASTPLQLDLDIMAILSSTENNSSQGILRAILSDDLQTKNNDTVQNIIKFGSPDALEKMIQRQTGYGDPIWDSLSGLMAHILFSALSVTMDPDVLTSLKQLISEKHKEYCYAFINEWLHSGDKETIYEHLRQIEDHFHLPTVFNKADIERIWDSDCFPCIDECIISKLMTEISENVIRPDLILKTVEKRRTSCWYNRFSNFYDGLQQIALMQKFVQANASGYHIATHETLWKEYCSNLSVMDTYYRQFQKAYGKNLKEASTILDDLFNSTAEYVERLYKNNYLSALSSQWNKLTRDEFSQSARLSGIPHQEDFYMNNVQRIVNAGQRVYVIISDGLRYEIADELTQELIRDTKGTAKLSSVQSVFPSTTSFGMAALLPHNKLELQNNGDVYCDGMPTEKTEQRDKILKKAHPGNIAITSTSFLKKKQQERRETVSEAKCVYIYHNVIDAVGDKHITEDRVFEACDEAILEIKKLVKMIVNELSGTNIFITADHGFLYSYQPLENWEKTGKDKVTGKIINLGHRWVIAEQDSNAEYLQRIPLDYLNSSLIGYTPAENIRITTGSSGINYVHGGVALQECVVPVIEFKNKRPGSRNYEDMKKVELQLISTGRKISNSIFTLNFYQKEPVGGKTSPAEYEIYMADVAGKVISDRQKVIADRTSANNDERVFRVRFTLKSMTFSNTETYYLVITDKDSGSIISQTEFNIDITFVNDFDF